MNSAASTLTMQDVADLAHVRRSTVSMWRNRPMARGQFLPFPAPVGATNGVEQFSREEIVNWLEHSGRGNNHEHRLDAPALSPPAGISLETWSRYCACRFMPGRISSRPRPLSENP